MLTLCQVQGWEIHKFDSIWFCVLSIIIPFYWRQSWGLERAANSPKIPQLISAGSKIQIKVVWFKVFALSLTTILHNLVVSLHTLMRFRCEMINLGAVSGGRGVEEGVYQNVFIHTSENLQKPHCEWPNTFSCKDADALERQVTLRRVMSLKRKDLIVLCPHCVYRKIPEFITKQPRCYSLPVQLYISAFRWKVKNELSTWSNSEEAESFTWVVCHNTRLTPLKRELTTKRCSGDLYATCYSRPFLNLSWT